MSLPAPTVVIFDMDGTTVRHLNPVVLHLLERYDDVAFMVSRLWNWVFRRSKTGPLFDWAAEEEYKNWRKPRLYGHRLLHKVRRRSVEEIVEPCPGVYLVLNLLQDRKIPMALASNGLGKGYGHEILEKFDLERYFKATIFREDIMKSKPHPDGLLRALKETAEIGPDDVVWFIGDRHKDVKAAVRAQEQLPCTIVPIAYGLNAATAILRDEIGVEHIMMSYPEIFKALRKSLPEKVKKKKPAAKAKKKAAPKKKAAAVTQPAKARTSEPVKTKSASKR